MTQYGFQDWSTGSPGRGLRSFGHPDAKRPVVTANAPNISVMVHLPELWFPASRGISSHLPNRPDSKRCTLQPSPPRASRRFRGLELRPVAVTTQHLHKGSGTSLRDDPDHGLRAGPKGGPSPLGRRKCYPFAASTLPRPEPSPEDDPRPTRLSGCRG